MYALWNYVLNPLDMLRETVACKAYENGRQYIILELPCIQNSKEKLSLKNAILGTETWNILFASNSTMEKTSDYEREV